jgi:hypothetical protein
MLAASVRIPAGVSGEDFPAFFPSTPTKLCARNKTLELPSPRRPSAHVFLSKGGHPMTHKFTVCTRIFSVVALLLSSTLIVVAQHPVPFINQPLVPDAFVPIAPGGPVSTFALTVNGTGFVPGSTVNWNGSPRTTAFVNGSRLIAFISRPTSLAPALLQ